MSDKNKSTKARISDVHGSGFAELLEELSYRTTDSYDPSDVLLVGSFENCADFTSQAKKAGCDTRRLFVGSSRVDLQACKLEYSIVSPK